MKGVYMALAKWYKIDFHTHTPESTCFQDKSVTPEQWLRAAKNSGLNAVVVSDHNSVGWISKIEEVKKSGMLYSFNEVNKYSGYILATKIL